MAKAKKTESTPDTAPKATPKKAVAKKAAPKPAAPNASPLIDTNLAAQNAARMLTARASGSAPSSQEGKKETSTFKQMKESFAKPHAASMNSLLNNTVSPGAKKSAQPFAGGKQVGHNQTFGADVTRTGVPRRTGG